MKKEPLFNEFSPVKTEEWLARIQKDLKGADFEKKLVTPLDEGFDIRPFYRKEDLAALDYLQSQPGEFPYVRGKQPAGLSWKVNQDFLVKDPEEANHEAQKAVENGAESLTFAFDKEKAFPGKRLPRLLNGLKPGKTDFYFRHGSPVECITTLKAMAQKEDAWQKITGGIDNDPVDRLNRTGTLAHPGKPFSLFLQTAAAALPLTGFRTVSVDGTVFHNAGGTTVSELAFTLAIGSLYMEQLTTAGWDAGKAAGKFFFRLATGSDYFMEIAKYRAFRYLWAQILKAFGVPEKEAIAHILAESSYRNKTVYDPYVNMLRTTTETMSAILGGVDEITVLPFDATFEPPSEMARRIARNQQLILKEESYFDKVADPAAGAYYIENLTDRLIEKSWDLFLQTEDRGGYIRAFQTGFVQQRIEKEAKKKDEDIAHRKISILGVNQFPNISEHKTEIPGLSFDSHPASLQDTSVKPLHIRRAAFPFEKLRYAVDRHAQKHARPKVWLFTWGNLAMRRARAQFAENFFGCAGYETIDHSGFQSTEEAIRQVKQDKPDIVVLCSDDETYRKEGIAIFNALKNNAIVVLAGFPRPGAETLQAAGMEHFIHAKSNVLETLQKFNALLGIGNNEKISNP